MADKTLYTGKRHDNSFDKISCTLRWRHNVRDGVPNYQPHDCLHSRVFRRRSKEISKLCVTGLCAGNSPRTGEFPAQKASNAENISIWWRHHDHGIYLPSVDYLGQIQFDIPLTCFSWTHSEAVSRHAMYQQIWFWSLQVLWGSYHILGNYTQICLLVVSSWKQVIIDLRPDSG